MDQRDYVIRLRPESGVDAEAALRPALKKLLRAHGLRAVEVRPVGEAKGESDTGRPHAAASKREN